MPDLAAVTAAAIKTMQDKSEAEAAEKAEARRMEQLKSEIARQDREREEKDEAERERKRRLAQVEKDAAEAKAKQQSEVESEKTREFVEMKERNEARIRQQKEDQKKLSEAKSMRERVGIRQSIEARERITGMPAETPGLKPITAGRIKESVKKVVGKAPTMLDKAVTSRGLTFMDTMVAARTPKQQTAIIKQEVQQISRAAKGHAKKPVTGGKVTTPVTFTPIVHSPSAVIINPNFMGNLLGQTQQVKKHVKSGMAGLDEFVRRL